MPAEPDVLELLLPDAPPADRDLAQRVTIFLRLLADDARAAAPTRARVDVPGAAREMELQDRERILAAVRDLLRHHLLAVRPPDSFAWYGEIELDHQAAWSRLEELRSERAEGPSAVPTVPAPGEPATRVVERLLGFATTAGLPPLELDLWHAHAALARGDASGDELAREGAAQAARAGRAELARAFLAARVAWRLDRGDPRRAANLLEGDRLDGDLLEAGPLAGNLLEGDLLEGDLLEGDLLEGARPYARLLTQMHGWCRCLLARELAPVISARRAPPLPLAAPLPLPLVELRDAVPAALPLLAGPPMACSGDPRGGGDAFDRRAYGASALLVLRLAAGGSRLVHADLAPGLAAVEGGLARWAARRELAFRDPREPDHRLVLDAAPVVVRSGAAGVPPRGALGAQALSLALVPVPDADGEVQGWVHLECEHRLLPSRARLATIASACPAALFRGDGEVPAGPPSRGPSPGTEWDPREPGPENGEEGPDGWDAGRTLFDELVAELGIKLQHRRWRGFVVEGERAVPLAAGGAGLPGSARPGRGRSLRRAIAAGGTASFDAPDPELCLDLRAGSGAVVPALLCGRVVALLAVESERRRDFRPRDLERLREALDRRALALRLAVFRAWHRRRHGVDLCLPADSPGFAAFATRLVTAGRSRGGSASPVVVAGPVGAGRRSLARWVHFEGTGGDAPLVRVPAGGGLRREPGGGPVLRRQLLEGEGTLLVEGLERLDSADQDVLLQALEGDPEPASARRIVAVVEGSLAAAVERGALGAELARRLDRVQLPVRPLAERREELPALVRFLARRFGEEERLPVPAFTDDALAALWRQDWTGNLPELENAVYKLVLSAPGEVLDAASVSRTLSAFGLELVPRLPSRHPRRRDVLAALRTTVRGTGRWNKTRAAAYLGWDPDTLVARIDDLGLDESGKGVAAESGWD